MKPEPHCLTRWKFALCKYTHVSMYIIIPMQYRTEMRYHKTYQIKIGYLFTPKIINVSVREHMY